MLTRLMTAPDTINKRFGKGTMKMAIAGLDGDSRAWFMKQQRRTPAYTTNWDDIPVARA
jgi:DNA polymerase V